MLQVARSSMAKSEMDWRAQHDLQTLIEAEKIKRDSARIKAVKKHKRDLEKSLKSL